MSENMAPKQLMIISAMIDMLRLFADNEIGGQYEINFDKLCNYIDSIRCVSDYFECDTEEDVYNKFTEDIYNGLPVWRFLILPEWTANMVEKSFNTECQNEYEQLLKTYKCLSCVDCAGRKHCLATPLPICQSVQFRHTELPPIPCCV